MLEAERPLLAVGQTVAQVARGAWGVVQGRNPGAIVLQAARLRVGARLAGGPQAARGKDEIAILIINDQHATAIGDGLGDNAITHWATSRTCSRTKGLAFTRYASSRRVITEAMVRHRARRSYPPD